MWIGVDPGKDTGIVVRSGDRLLWWTVVEGDKPTENEILSDRTIFAVNEAISEAYAYTPDDAPHVAVEGVIRPHAYHKGKIAFIDPWAVAVPALILGAIRSNWPVHVVIPPNGHGSNHLSTYPAELVTDAERRHGLNRPAGGSATVRHARSAFDIAGAATQALRIQVARAGAM